MAKQSGRNKNAVSNLEGDGYASAEMIIVLARTAEVDPLEGLLIAGYLEESEVNPPEFQVSETERDLVEEYRNLPSDGQAWMLGSLRGMRDFAKGQGERRQVAEDPGNYQEKQEPE